MKRRKRPKKKGAASWYVTYSDMVTLILVFFILLFSMSQVDQAKFDALTDSFQSRGVLDFLPSAIPNEETSDLGDEVDDGSTGDEDDSGEEDPFPFDPGIEREQLAALREEEANLDRLASEIQLYLEENALEDSITANRVNEGILLVLQDNIFFETGQAEILDTGLPFLNEIGELLSRIPNKVEVEGHTDSRPINTYRYPSNWELSGARASSVVRFLTEEFEFDTSRFSIAGYGDINPIVPNDSEENMELNRRVEITIVNSLYDEE